MYPRTYLPIYTHIQPTQPNLSHTDAALDYVFVTFESAAAALHAVRDVNRKNGRVKGGHSLRVTFRPFKGSRTNKGPMAGPGNAGGGFGGGPRAGKAWGGQGKQQEEWEHCQESGSGGYYGRPRASYHEQEGGRRQPQQQQQQEGTRHGWGGGRNRRVDDGPSSSSRDDRWDHRVRCLCCCLCLLA